MEDKKPWERPWTTQEMIDNASNWNLAGDAGLLKYLEQFSDNMLSKVKDTNERLNDLIDSAEETSLALNNATNRFMGLRNTQFIESRVYEDDETLPIKNPETEEKPKSSTETERLAEMKQAIVKGLEIIDKYYEKVEIPGSDSESENDSSEANVVYKPVDPYSDRPLPYVIGTAEWHKYWHVGLGHSSSDSEIENEEEQFSESESEEEDVQVLPSRPRISDSESKDYSKNKMSRPVANSTFNDQTTKNMFDSSSDSETGSLPPQVNTVNSNFAEELAAKLGKVESNIQVEVNTKPIQKPSTSNIPGGLFSDEPPPLDNDDIFVPKNDLFSGGNGLFDDDDDTDFWNTKTKPPSVSSINKVANKKPSESTKDLFSEEQDDDIFNSKSNISESKPEKPVKKSLGLFDDDEDDLNEVDNIFNSSTLAQNKKTLFPSLTISKTAPIISEEPPEITSDTTKKPVGGVSILGPNVLLDSKIFQKRVASSSSSDSDNDSNKDFNNTNKDFDNSNKDKSTIKDFDKNLNDSLNKEPIKTTDKVEEAPKKLPSLFDDSSPLFTDDIFASSSINKFSSKLFEAEEPPPLETKTNTNKNTSIFDEEPNDDFEDELFSPKPKIEKTPETTNKKATSLFLEDNDDDLFSTIDNSNKRGHSLFDPNPPSLIESKSNNPKSVNLFDPNPPELDESDEKSEPTSSYGSLNAARAFLYDTEPPMLSNESSGIARDQSTRLESEDSSFNPYLTSSRRHSDIFQDTQTTDSLLTTRNKVSFPEDTTQKSNLSGIPEIDSSSTKIDITASGNESSLVANLGDEDVFKTNISSEVKEKPIIQKKPNLFGDENDIKPKNIEKKTSLFDDDDDNNSSIFKTKDEDTKPKNIINEETRKNVFIAAKKDDSDSDDDLFSFANKKIDVDIKNKENDDKKFNYEQNLKSDEDIKVDPKKSLSFERNNENEKIGASSKEEIDGEINSAGNSPGKLKHNLNINLQALLPGASPPKKKVEKSASLESSESQNQSSTPTEEPLFKAPHPVYPNIQKPSFEKSISFEAPVDHHEILPNAVKERAKIPVKRRPSTRRARQEAIRKSAADLKFEDALLENDFSQTQNNNNKVENETTNPLSPSTDEEDFPTMPLVKDLSDNFTENSLFGKAPIISPIEDILSKDVPSKETPPKEDTPKEDIPKEDIPKEVPPKKEEPEDLFDIIKMPPQNLDLFSPSKSDQPNLFTNNMSASNTSKASIFSSSDSENDLFSTPKTEIKKDNSKVVLSSPDEDLFKPSSKESYDDLFKNDPIFSKKKPLTTTSSTKKSLFDDDDDDDDIFGGSSTKQTSNTSNTSNTSGSSVTIKKPIVNKLKKMPVDPVEDILDPLEALLKK